MLPIRILGTGNYTPGDPIPNNELQALTGLEFDLEKLQQKLGIYSRHIAHLRDIQESTADFATKAAENALQAAGIPAEKLDLIIVATDTPEYISPSTSMLVQGRLQNGETWATSFDVNASCASFAIALDTASRIIATDTQVRYAVVIGVYNMTAYIRPDDAFGTFIFADGAGAFVLGRTTSAEDPSGYINGQHLTDGTQWNYIGVYAGGTHTPVTTDIIEKNEQGLLNLQPLPGDRNVRLWPMVVQKLLEKSGMQISDVDHFLFTQINRSVIEQVMHILGQPMEKTTCAMDRFGYTGSACIPMAFHVAVSEGRIRRGDTVIFTASGAGLAVGSNLFVY
jgi:3-oxoacyl-[acyl-carrier-protein] synthase-3